MGQSVALLALTIALPAGAAQIDSGGRSDFIPVRSWSEIRQKGVVKQQFDYSCGAAALATLLTHYYGVMINEKEIIERIGLKEKFSFADLARVADGLGFKAAGLVLDYSSLLRIRLPAIVHLTHWEDGHFAVLTGIDEHGVRLADPSWGKRFLRREKFKKLWNPDTKQGKILVVLPVAATRVALNSKYFGFEQEAVQVFLSFP